MPNCSNYCDDPMGDFESGQQCGAAPPGGLPSMVLFTCDHTVTDFEDEAQILAALADGTAFEVFDISMTINAPTPVTRDNSSPCDSTPKLITYDWTGDYINQNISTTNVDSHNQLFDGRQWGAMMLLHCTEAGDVEYVSVVDAAVTFRGGRAVGAKKADAHQFGGQALWQSRASASYFPAPPGIFT